MPHNKELMLRTYLYYIQVSLVVVLYVLTYKFRSTIETILALVFETSLGKLGRKLPVGILLTTSYKFLIVFSLEGASSGGWRRVNDP